MILVRDFFSGFGFIIEGKRLFREVPGIQFWIAIPFLISILILAAGVFFGSALVQGWVYSASLAIFGAEGLGQSLFYYPTLILFWFIFMIVFLYFVYLAASIVASPFYAIVAEKILVHFQIIDPSDSSFGRVIRTSIRMFFISLIRGAILLVLGLFLFLASFIPGLNLVASFAIFVILATDAMDYGFEALGYGLKERILFIFKNGRQFCGMGAFLGLTAFVPGLILLIMPFAVIGATGLLRKTLHDSRNNT